MPDVMAASDKQMNGAISSTRRIAPVIAEDSGAPIMQTRNIKEHLLCRLGMHKWVKTTNEVIEFKTCSRCHKLYHLVRIR